MYKIENITINNLNTIVNIHMLSFKDNFLTKFGDSFLSNFYKFILCKPGNFGYLVKYNDEFVGFVVGANSNFSIYKNILKNAKNYILIMKIFFNKPSLFFSFVQKLFYSPNFIYNNNSIILLSICVHPNFQNLGLGSILIDIFEKSAKENGYKYIYLTTDSIENDTVNKFYKKKNYDILKVFRQTKSRYMNLYLKNI